MIKGKRIGDINLKVTVPMKTNQKQVGITLGKFYIPEKTQFQLIKEMLPCENEEDAKFEKRQTKNGQEKPLSNSQHTDQKNLRVKNVQKDSRNDSKNQKNEDKKKNLAKNKSLQKYLKKKQNKVLNSFSKKQLKSTDHSVRECLKKKEIKDSSAKNLPIIDSQTNVFPSSINDKQEKISSQKEIVQISKVQTIQFEEDDSCEVEKERQYIPDPIKNQFLTEQLEPPEISFRNNDFQFPEVQQHFQALSSQEQDDSSLQEQRGVQTLKPIRQQTSPNSTPQISGLTLNLNEELFSLSAQELLAKQYFNI